MTLDLTQIEANHKSDSSKEAAVAYVEAIIKNEKFNNIDECIASITYTLYSYFDSDEERPVASIFFASLCDKLEKPQEFGVTPQFKSKLININN